MAPTTAGVRGRQPPVEVPLSGQRAGVQGIASPASDSTISGGLIELARLRSTCGAFGHVYMGMNLDSGELLAVKQNDEETDPFGAEREDMKMEKLRRFEASSMDDDLKLSVCREIGSSSNRLGKRKVSWQDQLALRV
ncbi:Mitogen-activated protein kinase kinase kinase 3 [Platanthera guangdongensis]|uniref:Mitogen-activated protein kinase kinase kinase 3 n=1 Tax=Platanthera guangdongensis TaxID=2320717 RepID=A0ABR2N0E8_9ASPA